MDSENILFFKYGYCVLNVLLLLSCHSLYPRVAISTVTPVSIINLYIPLQSTLTKRLYKALHRSEGLIYFTLIIRITTHIDLNKSTAKPYIDQDYKPYINLVIKPYNDFY